MLPNFLTVPLLVESVSSGVVCLLGVSLAWNRAGKQKERNRTGLRKCAHQYDEAQRNNDTRALSTKSVVYISLDVFCFVNLTSTCSLRRKGGKKKRKNTIK